MPTAAKRRTTRKPKRGRLRQLFDRWRGSSTQRGYGYRWQQARISWLNEYPLCAECKRQGKITPASVVDHIKPHRGDEDMFWDESNWQSLCKACHDQKTARGE